MKHKFIKATQQNSLLLHSGRWLWDGKVTFKLSEMPTHVDLDYLAAIPPFQNNGERFMDWFTKAADSHGVMIRLQCAQDLMRWYGKFGFEQSEGACTMIREPIMAYCLES